MAQKTFGASAEDHFHDSVTSTMFLEVFVLFFGGGFKPRGTKPFSRPVTDEGFRYDSQA